MRISVAHCFHQYLNTTENWAYRLISAAPGIDVHVVSKEFLPTNFYDPAFRYYLPPLARPRPKFTGLIGSYWTKTVERSLRAYPYYLARALPHIDIVHSHFSFVAWEYRALPRLRRLPHFVSFYGFDYEWLPRNQPEWRERYATLFREVDTVLCEGSHGVRTLERAGCPPHKLAVARLGVDTTTIQMAEGRRRGNGLRLVQIARLAGKKGHVDTLRAFAKALPECPGATLAIVGGNLGGMRERLELLASELGVRDRVTFVEAIDFSRLHEFLGGFDVFIHPSCHMPDGDCEGGAPVVLLDAQAVGLPVISTTHCDIPDLVPHGASGFLSAEHDVEGLAAGIRTLHAMSDDAFGDMRAAARRHVESEFDVRRCGERLRELYAARVGRTR